MPKSTKETASAKEGLPDGKDPEMSFEEALSRLETLVQGMESDTVPLDDLIKNYEEGTVLYRVCEKRLDEAQGRIEIIRKKRNGTVKIQDLDESGKAAAANNSEGASPVTSDVSGNES